MHARTHLAALLCLLLLAMLLVAPTAGATTTSVTSNPFSASGTLTTTEIWDSFELSASSGSRVTYTVTAASGGCVMVLFTQGHSVTMSSSYYISYSQENCVSSYTNTFPVGSNDGTDFSVVVSSTASMDVPYTVNISVAPPSELGAILGVLVIVVIVVIVAVVLVVRRRRKKVVSVPPPYIPSMMPPPAYTPPDQTPLPQPPEQPPWNPGTPP